MLPGGVAGTVQSADKMNHSGASASTVSAARQIKAAGDRGAPTGCNKMWEERLVLLEIVDCSKEFVYNLVVIISHNATNFLH